MIKKGVVIFSLLFLTSVIIFSFGVSAAIDCASLNQGEYCQVAACPIQELRNGIIVVTTGSEANSIYWNGVVAPWELKSGLYQDPHFGRWGFSGSDTICSENKGYSSFSPNDIVKYCSANSEVLSASYYICTISENPITPFCFDSDGGKVYDVYGYATNEYGSNYYDQCTPTSTDPDRLREYFCYEGTSVGYEYYSCPFGCNGGKCNSQPPPVCEDSDGGNYIMTPGTVTYDGATYKDTCYGSSTILENYCSNGVRVSNTGGCGEGYSCFTNSNYEGYCALTPTCSDSDGGINYNVQGTVTKETGATYTDYCYDDPMFESGGLFLREYYCSGTNVGAISYQCPYGCTNGKCDSAPPFCSDTDGGNEPWFKGTVSTEAGNYIDECFDSGGGGTGYAITGLAVLGDSLLENFCSGETRTTQNYDCNLGCFDGACSKLYFGDVYGVELADYSSKNIGDVVYGWSRNIQTLQGGFVDGKFMGDYTLTIKEYDPFLPDDIIRENVLITRDDPNNGYGFGWLITQEDVDICTAGEIEGNDCEFYFVLVDTYRGITYDSRETSPLLLVPVETSTTNLPQRYWADYGDLNVQVTSYSWTGSPINLGLVMLNYTGGGDPLFTITESNGFASMFIGSFGGDVMDINNDGNPDAYTYWTIDQAVIDMVYPEFDDWPLEFFFDVEGGSSGVFTLTYPQGPCNFNGICEPELGETPENCADCQAVQCAGINLCQDYLNVDMCESDTCGVAAQTPPPAGQGQIDACAWNSSKEPSCNKVLYSTTINGNTIGLCNSEQNSTSDECIGGFLSYSWTSTWVWAEDNSFESKAECEAYSPDCVDKCSEGTSDPVVWHCDPNGAQASCVDGSARIPCPAQIQLDFFDLRNVIVAVLLILILYVIFYKVKKSRRASKGKKRK